MIGIRVGPGEAFNTVLNGAPTDLANVLVAELLAPATGAVVQTASDIREVTAPSGNYVADFVGPAIQGTYLIQWKYLAVEVLDDELVEVTLFNTPIDDIYPTSSYASRSDLTNYVVGGYGTYSDVEIDRVLALASKDVDRYAIPYARYKYSELQFYLDMDALVWRTDLTLTQIEGIRLATCAQAEYRLAKGEQFFVEQQPVDDGRKEPRFGPKAKEELRAVGFPRRSTTTSNSRSAQLDDPYGL